MHNDLAPLLDPALAPFYHGVASGDPTQSAVIIWTRVTPMQKTSADVTVSYEVSETADCKRPVASGKFVTGPSRDYTVKVDVTGLKENTVYYYRFRYKGKYSVIGSTKTLAADPEKMTVAFVACSNYEWGFFNNYRFIAENPDIEMVVHLGDYIYEYAPGGYGDTTLGRKHVPAKEITTLEDYRTRYSQYRLDPDLREAHRLKPFVTTWDDHEIANNSYVDGAQNHQEDEGDWYIRKEAGSRAYYEWMPVRETPEHELYRSFRVGKLLSLIILDTRIAGRSAQVDSITDPHVNDADRTILGKQQYDWFTQRLGEETAWKIVGNQVPFGPMYQPDNELPRHGYLDGWDGYPAERKRLIDLLRRLQLKDVVWVTGDYHASFAMENDETGTADPTDNVSVEFVVTSITSANADEYTNDRKELDEHHDLYMRNNPQAKYINDEDHGFLVLTIRKEHVEAAFYYATTIRQKEASPRLDKTYVVRRGVPVLEER